MSKPRKIETNSGWIYEEYYTENRYRYYSSKGYFDKVAIKSLKEIKGKKGRKFEI